MFLAGFGSGEHISKAEFGRIFLIKNRLQAARGQAGEPDGQAGMPRG
jgi:hypothetical protein